MGRLDWLILVGAGLLEVGWSIGLKYTEGFTRPLPMVVTAILTVASMWMLAVAVRTLPIGTAYGVWVGIGAAGAAVAGTLLFGEPMSPWRAFFIALLLAAIVGLKFTSAGPPAG